MKTPPLASERSFCRSPATHDSDDAEFADPWKRAIAGVSLVMTEAAKGRGVKAGPQQTDVSKTQFDSQPRTLKIGRFTEFPDENGCQIPVFFRVSGRILKPASLPELLKENPQSDVLVGVTEVR